MDEAGWDVEEAALLDDGVLAALGAELEPSAAADDVSPWWCQPEVTPPSARTRVSIPFSVSKASSRVRPGVVAAAGSPSGPTVVMDRVVELTRRS